MTLLKRMIAWLDYKPFSQKDSPLELVTVKEPDIQASLIVHMKNNTTIGWATLSQEHINDWSRQVESFTNDEDGSLVIWHCEKNYPWCCSSVPFGSIDHLELKSSVQPTKEKQVSEDQATAEAALAALEEKDNTIIADLGRKLIRAEDSLELIKSELAAEQKMRKQMEEQLEAASSRITDLVTYRLEKCTNKEESA